MFEALKSQRISLQLMLLVFGILPFVALLIHPQADLPFTHNAQGLIYSTYLKLLGSRPVLLLAGSYLSLTLFSSYLFWFNIRFEIIGTRTVLISYVFYFLAAIPMYLGYLHPGQLSGMLVFTGLVSVFNIYGNTGYLKSIFNSGLLFGLAFLLYPPFLLLLPVFFIAIARMKQPALRDYLVLILGLLTVAWIYAAILILTGNFAYEWLSSRQWFEIRRTWPVPVTGNYVLQLIWLIWIILLLPMALSASRARKDTGRRIISVLAHFLWIAPVMLLGLERVSFEVWGLVCLPLASLFSLAIMNSGKRWMSNLFMMGLVLFLITFQILRLL